MLDLESARNLSPETGTESPHPRLGIADLPTDLLALCLDKAYPHGAGSLFLVTVSRTSRAFRAAARQVSKVVTTLCSDLTVPADGVGPARHCWMQADRYLSTLSGMPVHSRCLEHIPGV